VIARDQDAENVARDNGMSINSADLLVSVRKPMSCEARVVLRPTFLGTHLAPVVAAELRIGHPFEIKDGKTVGKSN
jgi:hypothetical protein